MDLSVASPKLKEAQKRGGLKSALSRAVNFIDQLDATGLNRSLLTEAAGLVRRPGKTGAAVSRFLVGELSALVASTARLAGAPVEGPIPPPAKDRRFADKAWEENAFFFGLLQGHLLRERLAQELVEAAALSPVAASKARLMSQLLVEALSPSNFLWSNPGALKRAFETGGLSVVRGLMSFLEDVRTRHGWPKQVDGSSFQIGKNLAATPGKVVFRNHLMELIQYAPVTAETYRVPLLLSPPWINKYYIMDLAPGRSFAEWAVKHGHTTFAISYRNPDASMHDVSLDDYLLDGPLAATRVIREITGAPKVNLAALCLGGTLATMLLAYLNETGEDWVNSVTLLNTLVDFSEPGMLGAFTDAKTIERIGRRMAARGYLTAEEMGGTFNLLRSSDLVFSYVASRWLMGEPLPAFDLLAWNGDGTRMPARMHMAYLKACYLENRLAKDELVVGGQHLRPSTIRQDAFILAAVEDHITPWKSSFKTTRLLAGKVRFLLSSSGHIAGIVNPPHKNAVYWMNDKLEADPELWRAGASRRNESWWEEWARWVSSRAGALGAPPPMGSTSHPPLMEAPGAYILEH
ncbi:MAG: PHA/PHB synthase family protein [Myxococcaceae bacterium]